MIYVPLLAIFFTGIVPDSPVFAQPAAFCPEGWACGMPEGHRAETRRVAGRRDICMIHNTLTTRDGAWEMLTLLYSTDTGREVHIGFAVTLLEPSTPGTGYRQIPLRRVRLLSADRRLDTLVWRLDGADTTRTSVRMTVTEGTKNQIAASIAIATGAAYGVLAETTDGRHVRIEAGAVGRARAAIRDFQSCIENRDKPAGD